MLAVILVWSLVSALGLAGLILALAPGRFVSRDPHCRKCRFNLAGLVDHPQAMNGDGALRCPECGRNVSAKRAVRAGLRRRSRVRLGFAGGLLLLALAGIGGLSWSAISGYNWSRFKPIWLLELEASSNSPASATPALQELARRAGAGAGALSSARLARLARKSLAIQADDNATWIDWRGDLIEHAAKAGLLTDAEIAAYAKRIVLIGLESRSPIQVGDSLGISLGVADDRGAAKAGGSALLSARVERLDVNGEPIAGGPLDIAVVSGGGRHMGSIGRRFDLPDLPTGRHTVRVHLRLAIHKGAQGVPAGGVLGGLPPREDAPIATWEEDLTSTFELVGPETPLVTLRPDPALAAEIRKLITVQARVVPSSDEPTARLSVQVGAPRMLPTAVAFAIIARVGGREIPLNGGAAFGPKRGGFAAGTTALPDWFTADAIDVILRPDARIARERGVLGDIWDGELIFESVSVQWNAPKPTPAPPSEAPAKDPLPLGEGGERSEPVFSLAARASRP